MPNKIINQLHFNHRSIIDESDYATIPPTKSMAPPPPPPLPPMTTATASKTTRIQNYQNKPSLPSPRSESEADSESATWVSLEDSRSEMSYSTNSTRSTGSTESTGGSSAGEGDSAFSMAGTEDDCRVDELIHTRTAVMTSGAAAIMTQVIKTWDSLLPLDSILHIIDHTSKFSMIQSNTKKVNTIFLFLLFCVIEGVEWIYIETNYMVRQKIDWILSNDLICIIYHQVH